MVKFILPALMLIISLFGFMNNENESYDELWKQVQQFERENLPESAVKIIDDIISKGTKENNHLQTTKASLYKAKFILNTSEDGFKQMVVFLDTRIKETPSPYKQVMHQGFATVLKTYLQSNYYVISQRVDLGEKSSSDPTSWSANIFHQEITNHYVASLDLPEDLDIPVQEIELLVQNMDKTGLEYAPTLYDLLARKAIQYFSNPSSYVSKPIQAFELDKEAFFNDAEFFINYKPNVVDTTAHIYQAFLFYQKYLQWNINRKNTLSLAQADLDRLTFVYRTSTLQEKEDYYVNRLNEFISDYGDTPMESEFIYLKAKHFFDNQGHITRKQAIETNTDPIKEVLEQCQLAIEKNPDSKGANQAVNLHNQIFQKSLSAQHESVLLPSESNLIFLRTKNVKEVSVRVVQLTELEWRKIHERGKYDARALYLSKKGLVEFDHSIAEDKTPYIQTAEIELPSLALGFYGMLIVEKGTPFNADQALYAGNFTVSNISYFLQNSNKINELVVAHRKNGHPMSEVDIDIFKNYYSRDDRKHKTEFLKKVQTDDNGRISLSDLVDREIGYSFRLSKGDDRLENNQSQHLYRYSHEPRPRDQYLIFTDRAIYRPGQQVFFKVLALHKDKEQMPGILADHEFVIEYKDSNGQVIETLNLKTNEFGSASGIFSTPKGVLKGQMSLVTPYGNKSIRVEEYKRPKIFAEVEPIEGEYKLLDVINATIVANNFAGNPVQGANVSYRVRREVRYPYWRHWHYRGYMPMNSNSKEITNGTGVLDKDGKLQISFEASPDKSVDLEHKPVFRYIISADVTDINGETQSTESTVSVSTQTMQLSLAFPQKMLSKESHELAISASNLSGSKVSAKGSISIFKMEDNNRIERKRYWQHPDTILIDKQSFKSRLSAYSWDTYSGIETWEVGERIFEQSFEYTPDKDKIGIDTIEKLKGGAYKIIAKAIDKNGNEITEVQFFEVLDFNKNDFSSAKGLHYSLDQKTYQPGDRAILNLGSSEKDLEIYYYIEQKGDLSLGNWMKLKRPAQITIPIAEKNRGGMSVHLIYVWNNRFFSEQVPISIPWTNKDLDIEYVSFRNKLLPGAKEVFQVKINSPISDIGKTEMLAAMYDASLDQFVPHNWKDQTAGLYPMFYSNFNTQPFAFNASSLRSFNRLQPDQFIQSKYRSYSIPVLDFNMLSQFYGGGFGNRQYMDGVRKDSKMMKRSAPAPSSANMDMDMMVAEEAEFSAAKVGDVNQESVESGNSINEEQNNSPSIRENLNETVFMYPDLETDSEGNVSLVFTMGEALTKWKLLSFVHDKDLRYGHDEQELQTQKDLMVFPNLPRFLRDGDDIYLQSKIVNVTNERLTGNVRIEILDALTGEQVEEKFGVSNLIQKINIDANGSIVKRWKLNIPNRLIDAVLVRVIAKAGQHSDGEENMLPVLTDRMLVTETRSIIVDAYSTKEIEFESFSTAQSSTIVHKKYTLEYTPNPAWYAIQALPYLMEYPHKCTEQVLNRFYANSLAQQVANSHPNIKRVFDSWKNGDEDALLSNLEKNEDLKSALLKESPWVLDGKSESAAKRKIANLFELNRMANEIKVAIQTLLQRQMHDGGFPWFEGGYANRYITQYVLESIGHMQKLEVLNDQESNDIRELISKALVYIDKAINKEYQDLLKSGTNMTKDHLSHTAIHYLYVRSFYEEREISDFAQKAYDYYIGQAKQYGIKKGIYGGSMVSISLLRLNEIEAASKIKKSILERAIKGSELGMYWNEGNGYRWHELPIEQHSLAIELMVEFEESDKTIENLKKWLLLNKQTNNWKTTKATAAAIYALLVKGESGVSDWILEEADSEIMVGNTIVDTNDDAEVATGYFRKDWQKESISEDMGKVTIKNNSNHLGWGGVYWQYFEDMDKVKSFKETPLQLRKEIYRIDVSDSGEQLIDVGGGEIKIGDKLMVRIKLQCDRSMEFVHLKDMRASGLEPLSTNSRYKWNHGLYYYESPGDLATDFFIDYLPKGDYVFEYRLVATQAGSFSNGIATIQNMYAPEYSSHSNGVTLVID